MEFFLPSRPPLGGCLLHARPALQLPPRVRIIIEPRTYDLFRVIIVVGLVRMKFEYQSVRACDSSTLGDTLPWQWLRLVSVAIDAILHMSDVCISVQQARTVIYSYNHHCTLFPSVKYLSLDFSGYCIPWYLEVPYLTWAK